MIIESKFTMTFTAHRPETISGRWWTETSTSNPTRRPTRRTIKITMERSGTETTGTTTVVVHGRIGETRRPRRTIIVVRVIIVVVVVVVAVAVVSSVPIQFG
jgi:hypothetical protein